MTVIIGREDNGKVYMGGDSIASDGYCKLIVASPKVSKMGEFIIGYTTSFRMGQLLQYELVVRKQNENETNEAYLVTVFVTAVRELFAAHGYSKIDNNRHEGGAALVGYRGELYTLESDYQISRWASSVATLGAGGQYALGAMAALRNHKPEEAIMTSLQITGELCALVAPPDYVDSI